MCKLLSDSTDPYQYEMVQGTPKMGKILRKNDARQRIWKQHRNLQGHLCWDPKHFILTTAFPFLAQGQLLYPTFPQE